MVKVVARILPSQMMRLENEMTVVSRGIKPWELNQLVNRTWGNDHLFEILDPIYEATYDALLF